MSESNLKILNERRSIREFTGEEVKEEDLQRMLEATSRSSTSVNGQQLSLIYTRDKKILSDISKLTDQPHIATADVFVLFVVDFYQTDYATRSVQQEHVIEQSAEGILVGAVDAGIALSSFQTAAHALGYGTTSIGAVRRDPKFFIDLFKLPKKTFPLVGTTLGIPSKEALQIPLKPRMPFNAFAMKDEYDIKTLEKGVDEYQESLKDYRKKNNMDFKTSYKDEMAFYYSRIYFPTVAEHLESQGFRFQDKLQE